jgi:hypothetical protein
MLAAGCTAEQIVAAVKAANDDDMVREQLQREANEAQVRLKREADAARKRRQRVAVTLGHTESSGQTVTAQDGADAPPPSPDKKAPHTPKELTPSAPASPARGEFDHFWAMFPNKVGKADASKAFVKARQRVDLQTMMDGLYRYVRKTDDRPWCNPSTWLNQDRWTDEPAAQARGSPQSKPRGMQGMFGEMREVLENGQADDGGSDRPARAPVLSLPYRRAG